MIGFGFGEVLLLALLAGGVNDTDLAALVEPQHYFASRQIKVSIDSMIDIAIAEPKDGKAQIMQLTALRYLTAETVAFKKADNYASNREAIEEIAQGKRAQDKAGFAKEYAQRMLDKLDGKKLAAVKWTPIRADAFAWFPADATLLYAIDMRSTGESAGDPVKHLLKLLPEREKNQLYDALEKCGNMRFERSASAFVEGTGKGDGKLFVRVTGKASQEALVELITNLDGGRMEAKKIKDDKGTPITLLQQANNNRSPVIMLIGTTDLVVVGYERGGDVGKPDDLIQELLDVRAKKKPNATAGKLKDRLAKIPDKAAGILVGDIPAGLKRDLAREFDAIPGSVFAFMERTPKGLELHAEGMMANAEDAGKLVEKIGALRKDGIAELQNVMQQPQPPGSPPIPFQSIINLLQTMQVQTQADKVNVRVLVPDALIQQLPLMMMPRRAVFDK